MPYCYQNLGYLSEAVVEVLCLVLLSMMAVLRAVFARRVVVVEVEVSVLVSATDAE